MAYLNAPRLKRRAALSEHVDTYAQFMQPATSEIATPPALIISVAVGLPRFHARIDSITYARSRRQTWDC